MGQYLCLGLSLLQLVMPVMGTETMVMDPQMDWDVLCVEWDLMLHRETTLVHHAGPNTDTGRNPTAISVAECGEFQR